MTRFSRHFKRHAVRKPELRALSEVDQGCLHHVGVLQDQIAMTEKHLDCFRNLRVPQPED